MAAHKLARFNLYMGNKQAKSRGQPTPGAPPVLLVYSPAADAASRLRRAYQLALEAVARAQEGVPASLVRLGVDGSSEGSG